MYIYIDEGMACETYINKINFIIQNKLSFFNYFGACLLIKVTGVHGKIITGY